MALDRYKLRDDLVTVIAAGRELSPENDYALADTFLRHAHESLLLEVNPPKRSPSGGSVAALIGAACLFLAALLSPSLLFHRDHDGNSFNQSVVVPHQFDRHHQFDRPGWWTTP
jgi:hypothetical protein